MAAEEVCKNTIKLYSYAIRVLTLAIAIETTLGVIALDLSNNNGR